MLSSSKTRKNQPWRGWKNERPNVHQRTMMQKRCGSKCFLGPISKKSFPICKKNTCKISRKGIYAAYIRASQTKRNRVVKRAKKMLRIK